MTPNNNLSVLPFYEGVQYQDYKKSYAYGDVYPLFTPINKLLPFHVSIGSGLVTPLPPHWMSSVLNTSSYRALGGTPKR